MAKAKAFITAEPANVPAMAGLLYRLIAVGEVVQGQRGHGAGDETDTDGGEGLPADRLIGTATAADGGLGWCREVDYVGISHLGTPIKFPVVRPSSVLSAPSGAASYVRPASRRSRERMFGLGKFPNVLSRDVGPQP
jgi:hypothetical protein